MQPSSQPSTQPSVQPTTQPTVHPSMQPTTQPSSQPTMQPSSQPSMKAAKQSRKQTDWTKPGKMEGLYDAVDLHKPHLASSGNVELTWLKVAYALKQTSSFIQGDAELETLEINQFKDKIRYKFARDMKKILAAFLSPQANLSGSGPMTALEEKLKQFAEEVQAMKDRKKEDEEISDAKKADMAKMELNHGMVAADECAADDVTDLTDATPKIGHTPKRPAAPPSIAVITASKRPKYEDPLDNFLTNLKTNEEERAEKKRERNEERQLAILKNKTMQHHNYVLS